MKNFSYKYWNAESFNGMVILHVMTVWQKQFFKEQLKAAKRGVNQENLGYPTSKNTPKWTYIPFSPLPKTDNCGEVCASQLVPLRHKPREDDDDDDIYQMNFSFFFFDGEIDHSHKLA